MSPVTIGLIGIVVLLLFFLLKMPVAFAMAFTGFLGFSYLVSLQAGLSLVAQDFFEQFSSYFLSVITAFMLMGTFSSATGVSTRLYKSAHIWFGRLPGGLAIATISATAAFSAICGSSPAATGTMATIAFPEMKRFGYDSGLASGCIASAGSLGILIPPSTILILYGILTEQPIGKLFIAGVFPGLILAGLFVITLLLIVMHNPTLAPAGAPSTWKEKVKALPRIIETLIIFILVIGGMFLGWFTPTQAGAIGAAGILLLGLISRDLTWSRFIESTRDGVRLACMVVCLITGGVIFGHFIAMSHIPFVLTGWIEGLPLSPVAILGIICLAYFIAGCFVDAMALLVLTIPIIYPLILDLGFDPIWFGVIIVLICQVGVLTPPVGINAYVMKGLAPEVPLERIFRGIFPYLGALILGLALLVAFPQIVTFLPSMATY